MKEMLLTERDGTPCVIIFPWDHKRGVIAIWRQVWFKLYLSVVVYLRISFGRLGLVISLFFRTWFFLVRQIPLILEALQYFLSKFTVYSYIYKSLSFEIFLLHLTILICLFVKKSVKQLSNYCCEWYTI